MDPKQGCIPEFNCEEAAVKGRDSCQEASRCEQWDESMRTWPKPKVSWPTSLLCFSTNHVKSLEQSNSSGRVRKRGEYEDGEEERARLAWALKNWPTRDTPIPSIETPDEELEVPEVPEESESDEPAPKRQKSMPADKFEALWHYLENNTPDMRSPTLFPPMSPISDLDDSPHNVSTDASLDSSLLTETTVPADDGEIVCCEEAESDPAC